MIYCRINLQVISMNKSRILNVLIIVFVIIFLAYNTYHYIKTQEKDIYVGYLPSNHHAAAFVAAEMNMYSKADLKVNLIPFRSGRDITVAMEKGQIDVAYCGIAPATEAISKGDPIKIVAPVNNGGSGIVIPLNHSLNTSEAFIDKTVAIPAVGSVQDVLLHDLLQDNNINPSQLNIIEMETPLMPASLKNGKIDAYVAWEPYVTAANISGYGTVLLYSDEWWSNHPCCVVIASDNFIKNNPSELSRFLKVHVKATTFIENNPEKASEIVSKKLGASLILENESLKHLNYTCCPSQNFTTDVRQFMEIQMRLGYLTRIPDNESLYDFEFLSLQ